MLEIRGTGKLVTWDAESLINGRSSSHQSRDGVKEQHGRRDQNVYKSTSGQTAANGTIRVFIAASNCIPNSRSLWLMATVKLTAAYLSHPFS